MFVIWFLLVNYISVSSGSKNIQCTQLENCKCIFPYGLGVDLSIMDSHYFNISKNERLIFYPCNDFVFNNSTTNGTINECLTGAALCLESWVGNISNSIILGTVAESQFEWINIAVEPILSFRHLNRTTKIRLKCMESKENNLELLSKLNDVYDLELRSESACVRTVSNEGHSVFSTILLIFLVLFLFYLLCGFLVLRFIRGACGWEAIPNGEFWRSVWFSFKKTCVYFMNGCRHPDIYDTI